MNGFSLRVLEQKYPALLGKRPEPTGPPFPDPVPIAPRPCSLTNCWFAVTNGAGVLLKLSPTLFENRLLLQWHLDLFRRCLLNHSTYVSVPPTYNFHGIRIHLPSNAICHFRPMSSLMTSLQPSFNFTETHLDAYAEFHLISYDLALTVYLYRLSSSWKVEICRSSTGECSWLLDEPRWVDC